MKEQASVTLQDWSDLYKIAVTFKQLKCWEWMYDDDLFGVKNPETDEIGYCCVMGSLGEVFALSLYPGTEGLDSYWFIHEQAALAEEGIPMNSFDIFTNQQCLMVSFENRRELHKNDLTVIRELDLKFRGKKEWPLFRSYRPGYLPWFLTSSEVRFLTLALQQAVEIVFQCKNTPHLLEPPERGKEQYFVRVLQRGKWQNTWQEPAAYEDSLAHSFLNEILLAQLKQANFPHQGIWITDCLLLPIVIQEGERPYYPYGFPILSSEGMAYSMELLQPGKVEKELPNKFMELLQKMKFLPQSLLVGNEQTFELLEPIADKLAFTIQQTEELPALDSFLDSMGAFFNGSE